MIQTERLSIRRVQAGDWQAIQTVWKEVAKTAYARYDNPKDTADQAVQPRIERWASFAGSTEHMFFAVVLADAVIGYIALNQRGRSHEIGYCFHPAYHGNGYAKESISAVLRAVKSMGIDCVTAGTALENAPSVRLLTSLGFRLAGTEKVSFYQDAQGNAIVFDGGIYELKL